MIFNRSYNYNDVLTRASITIQVIEDVALYKAQLFSSNGNIFSQRDESTDLHVRIFKGFEDISDRFNDIVWKRFTAESGNMEEDAAWGEQHKGKKDIVVTKDDIQSKANIQVEVYSLIDGKRSLVAVDFITFIDVNDLQGSPTPPNNPQDGDLWLDTSVMPPRLMVWDAKLGKWIEVVVAGNDRRNLIRHSNFYKKNFDYWTSVNSPTLEIESLNGKKWARIKSDTIKNSYCGISQIVEAKSKSQYSFQMLSETYVQSAHPNGDAVVVFYSINEDGVKTIIKEDKFDLTTDAKVFTSVFSSLEDTKKIEVVISGQKDAEFDFVVTNIKLENHPVPTAWELAMEDMQDALDQKVGNSAEEVFQSLTDNGKMQGIYIDIDEHGVKNYYINGRYVNAKNLKVVNKNGVTTLYIDEDGNVSLNVSSFTLTAGADTNLATKEDIDNLQIGTRNLLVGTDFRDPSLWSYNINKWWTVLSKLTPNNNPSFYCQSTGETQPQWFWVKQNFKKMAIGKTYTFSASVYIPNDHGIDQGINIEIICLNSELKRTLTESKRVDITQVNKWVTYSVTFTVPANTTSIDCGVYMVQNGKAYVGDYILTEGNKPVAWSYSEEDIKNGIQIGVRNYIPNSAFKKGMEGYLIQNDTKPGTIELVEFEGRQCIKFTDIGCWDVSKYLRTPTFSFPGDEYLTFSMDVYITKGTKFFIDPDRILDQGDFTIDIPERNKWLRIGGTTVKKSRTSGDTSIAIYAARDTETISGYLTFLKAETGTKPSGWTEAPEDTEASINNKVDVGGSIDDVNQSNGQIEYPKLKIKGAITFEDLSSDNIANNFVPQRDSHGNVTSTLINGATIVAGSITGDLIKAYQLVVTKRKLENGKWVDTTIPTFSISQEGLIQASGTFKSFNFNGDETNLGNSKDGWIITNDGQSVFNDSIIRGRVELPNAGMTNYGGGENYNLFLNSDVRNLTVNNNVGWDNEKNGNLTIDLWGGYNKGVEKPNEGYHAHGNNKTFPFNVVEFNNHNSEIGLPHRWMGISQTIAINRYKFKPNTKYTFSMDVYFTKIGGRMYGGLYHKLNDKDTQNFSSGQFDFVAKTAEDLNRWKRMSWTFTTNENINVDFAPSWYIYGYSGQESTMYVTKMKLEEGEVDTGYAPTASEAKKEIRIYAGADYNHRHDAPLRILQDGTIIATRGEFGGTFTGRLEIGNISIYDDNTSYGVIDIKNNDNSQSIVRIGEDYSMFKSDVFIGDKDNYMFKSNMATKQLVSGKHSSIKFEYERDEGDDGIFASSITISGHKIQFNENEFMKSYYNGVLQIGSTSPKSRVLFKSAHDSEADGEQGIVDVEVHGKLGVTQTFNLGNVDIVPVYPEGLDFFVN